MNFDNFNHIADMNLQAWNRLMVSHNIAAELGEEPLCEYMRQFSNLDRQAMVLVASVVMTHGPEKARKIILDNVKYEEDNTPDTFLEDLEAEIKEEISLEEAEKLGYAT